MTEKPAVQQLVPAKPLEQGFGGPEVDGEVVATPAPEQVVTRAPAQPASQHAVREQRGSALDRAVGAAQSGFRDVAVSLGRVTSAGQEGGASGTGGLVVALAVLSLATALNRRRARRARWATDEDMPEFLYAWEVICPG